MTSEEIRRDAEKTARGFMGPLALLAPMTSDVLKTAIDTLADCIAAEREKVARLERERDELAAQLAALREAAERISLVVSNDQTARLAINGVTWRHVGDELRGKR